MIDVHLIFKLLWTFLRIIKKKAYIVPLKTICVILNLGCHFNWLYLGSEDLTLIVIYSKTHKAIVQYIQSLNNHGLPSGPHACQQSQASESCNSWLLPNPGKS